MFQISSLNDIFTPRLDFSGTLFHVIGTMLLG
jgi:hypothetical protein